MNIASIGSSASYAMQVAPRSVATAPRTSAASTAPVDSDGDHDGSTSRLDLKL